MLSCYDSDSQRYCLSLLFCSSWLLIPSSGKAEVFFADKERFVLVQLAPIQNSEERDCTFARAPEVRLWLKAYHAECSAEEECHPSCVILRDSTYQASPLPMCRN